MHNDRRRLAWLIFCSALVLTGCGGGGGGGGSNPVVVVTPSPTPTPGGSTCTSVSSSGRRVAAHGASGGVVPDRLFVTYRPSAGMRGAQSVERAANVVRAVDLGTVNGQIARAICPFTVPRSTARTTFAALRQNAAVADVQPVHYRGLAGDGVANDALLDNVDQWYLYKTNVDPGAWAITHGAAAVSVAVIDTGVDETNVDFVFDVKERVINGQKTTGAGSVQDTNGHGTNTSGLATATTNNSYGFAGVGYSTHLQAYDIFPDATAASDCQSADTADEATAIRDAVANGASVISLSIGSAQSQGADAAEQAAVAFAIANGVTVVAAAGNEFPGTDGQQLDFPAAYPGVIAVGASVTADAPTAITPGYAAGKSSCWPSVPGNSLPAAATTVTPLAIANATAACSAASAPWLCAEPMLRLITEAPLATASRIAVASSAVSAL